MNNDLEHHTFDRKDWRTYDFHPNYRQTSSVRSTKHNVSLDFASYVQNDIHMHSPVQTIFFDFDNRARLCEPPRTKLATVCINNTIEYQQLYCQKIVAFYNQKHHSRYFQGPNEQSMLLINAWNEWGEKMHIEPSAQKGDLYLRMLQQYFRPACGTTTVSTAIAVPTSRVLVVLWVENISIQQLTTAAQSHYRLFQHLHQRYNARVDTCILTNVGTILRPIVQLLYRANTNYIHRVSIQQCPREIEMHTLANQVLYRIQKHHDQCYKYVCLLQSHVCFKKEFFETLKLSVDRIMFFPLDNTCRKKHMHRNNPIVNTDCVFLPSSIVPKLSHFPFTPDALYYTQHPYMVCP